MDTFLGLPDQELTPEQEAEQIALSARERKANSFNAEQAAEQKELNECAVSKYRVENQEELEVYRPGRLLHHSEFLRLLRRLRPDAFFNNWGARGQIGLNLVDWHDERDEFGGTKKTYGPFTVTTLQLGISPEFSQIRTDSHGLPTGFRYRGWRKAVLDLITKGYITEEQSKVFGRAEGSDATRYNRELYSYRNTPK